MSPGFITSPIFEVLNWIFETTMGNNILVWYLAHTQHLRKPVGSEPICHGSLTPLLFEVKGLATRDYDIATAKQRVR